MLSTIETFHTHIMGYPQKDDQLKEWDSHITPPTERPRYDPGIMRRDIVHQKLSTLRTFSLLRIWGVSRYPEVVVCIEMGTLETFG
jgi:hypothetical protein